MSRTTPDPVFAAAARAELERRVRAGQGGRASMTAPSTARPRRAWITEFTAIAAVLVVSAGVVLGVQAFRLSTDGDGPPAGWTTATSEPRPSATPTVTPLRTPAPTVSARSTAAPSTAAPAPTREPTSARTTPPTATSTATPPVASTGSLIGPAGAQQRSAAEIRAWAAPLGFGDVWAEQAVLRTACMADQGFRYDPEFERTADTAARHVGLTDAQYEAFQAALHGPPTDAAYDWRTAGCDGAAVHETGQDGAN